MGFKVTVEVPLFFACFGFMLTASVNNNLIIYRTCYVILHQNKTECALLGFVDNNITENLEKLVEPTSDYISLVTSILNSVLSSLVCLFVAPWSDRFGRKPVFILALVGGTLSMILHTVYAAWENLSPWILMAFSVPIHLTGGGAAFMTVLAAYLSDVTTQAERGFRMGIFEVAMAISIVLGNTASPYLLEATNYVVVYCVSAACHVIGLIFTVFFIPESLQERENENKFGALLHLSNITEMIKTPFKRRDNFKRFTLLLIMGLIFVTCLGNGNGSRGLMFLFLRAKLHWTLTQFTWFSTANTVLTIFGTLLVVYLLHTVLKIRESLLILNGYAFTIASLVLFGLAVTDWQIYIAAIVSLPNSGGTALTRSLISKLVEEHEVAKVFSAFTIGSTILDPIAASSDPGFFNFVSAGILVLAAIFAVAIVIKTRDGIESNYSVLQSETNVNETEQEDGNAVMGQ